MYPLSTSTTYLVILSIVVLGYHYYKKFKTNPNRLPLPPGPKPLPVIGNALDIPAEQQWLTWDKWSKQYGDIVYATVLGQPLIVLGSTQVAFDLFEKRSTIYSSRASTPMLSELMGWDFSFAFTPYGDWWRRHRKTFHEYFHPRASQNYQQIQTKEARAFLRRLLSSPDNFLHHIRHVFASTIMNISYGIQVSGTDDEYVALAEEVLGSLAEAGVPGAFFVDLLPFLKYVPAWVPGASFKKKASQWRIVLEDFVNRPYTAVKDAMRKGTATPSIAASLIENLPDDDRYFEEDIIAKNCTAVAYAGGADTTVSMVASFFLAMAIYPDVQKRAQAELDSVIGQERLPDFNDRKSLPYINALMMEAARWQPVAPLGLPHCSTQDDEYGGFFIPSGSIIFGNIWAMTHNPDMYPDPEEFKPERFLKDGKLNPAITDPVSIVFGFGRRICPGRHVSENSLYTIVASVLSVYNIESPRDDQGNIAKLKPEMTSGFLSYPVPFKCTITPRSIAAEALIRDSELAGSL